LALARSKRGYHANGLLTTRPSLNRTVINFGVIPKETILTGLPEVLAPGIFNGNSMLFDQPFSLVQFVICKTVIYGQS
jgi:hypothetical protein